MRHDGHVSLTFGDLLSPSLPEAKCLIFDALIAFTEPLAF